MPPWIIQVKPWFFWWGDYRGIALYPFIFVTDKTDKKLMLHEKAHIRQQLDGWLIGFYIMYIYYHFKYGYWENIYEVEAREAENEYYNR